MTEKKALIIAEKPSVARDIVAALGGFRLSSPSVIHSASQKEGRSAQVWESDAFICTHALGHLLELYEPEDYHPAFKVWKLADLPIVPPHFLLKPKSETAPILRTIKQLLERPDVSVVMNACDAAREGELIFREVMEYARCNKQIKRVWLQSMTHEAIREAFDNASPGERYTGLSASAHGRSQADWLVGMNLSRAMTLKLARASEPGVWSVGRVQTPTLAMLVDREFQILSHDPRPYDLIKATFEAPDHTYEGTWFDVTCSTNEGGAASHNPKHIFAAEQTQKLLSLLTPPQDARATETRKTRLQKAPPLFHLTALQRYMANHYNWTAKQTLSVAQKCYEQHKVITYPRTEADVLPDDYRPVIKGLLEKLTKIPAYETFANFLLQEPWQNEERVFNSEHITDHFAIIPTGQFPQTLPSDEGVLFDVIIRRTMAALLPPAQIDQVERVTVVQGEFFKSGPEEFVRIPGWQDVWAKASPSKNRKTGLDLKPIEPHTVIKLTSIASKQEQTKPPPRIGEAQLLTMMEHAGRQVDDPDLAKALNAAGGLGTAATRAEIIENLKAKNFVFANASSSTMLQPTVKGMHLIRYLKLSRAEALTSASLTAEMESKLSEVEKERRTKDLFINETVQMVRDSLSAVERFNVDTSFQKAPSLGSCPKCTSKSTQDTQTVHERMWNYSCSSNLTSAENGCGFTLPKDLDGRYLDPATVTRLLESAKAPCDETVSTGRGILVEGFPSQTQHGGTEQRRLFIKDGSVCMLTAFGTPLDQSIHASPDQTSVRRRVTWGTCPVHKADTCLIVETKQAFICETRLRQLRSGGDASQGFYLPKTLCGRSLKPDEIRSFIHDGRTKKIEGFTSKGGKNFAASIVRAPSGQWNLEF